MRTRLSPGNPHSPSRHGFAWEMVPARSGAHLDFGCYDGAFLESLGGKQLGRRVGVDANAQALAEGRAKYPALELVHQLAPTPLPFAAQTFSSITILDVLEHVVEQEALLREFGRVLAGDGVLIVTVPGQYLLSFLDMGNLKFRFPRLHRWWYCRKHTRAEYESRYVANPDGMIGDISAEKAWHEHFSRSKLATLLGKAGFAVECFDGTAFFTRAIAPLRVTVGRVRSIGTILHGLARWDARTFSSMNLFCAARKRWSDRGNPGSHPRSPRPKVTGIASASRRKCGDGSRPPIQRAAASSGVEAVASAGSNSIAVARRRPAHTYASRATT